MTARVRLLCLAILCLLLPAVASAQWETPNRAFHKAAIFQLDGKHLSVPCASCHLNGQIKGTPTACADCHWVRRQDDKYRTRLGMTCQQCHRTTSWTAVKWDHGAQTGMPLNAVHKTLSCDTCHKNSVFTGANLTCGTCHAQDYAAAKAPDHKAAGFPTTCELCHRPNDTSFQQGRFDHNSVFPLTGLHATVECSTCHRNGVYKGTPRECVGCHRPDYDRTAQPNHAAAGISTECALCHRASDPAFISSTFNHSSVFPLVGLHAAQACASCHVNGVFAGTPRDCFGCHRTNYQKTTQPNHASAGYSTSCDQCHKPSDATWRTGTFNHSSVFALVGLHATQTCTTCHVNNVYAGTPRDCVGCHIANYQKTSTPNHAAAGYSTACDTCHKPTDPSWLSATFNHASTFPLVGLHATQTCATCHVNNVFKGTPRDCVGCHITNYQKTTTPSHAAAGYSTACDSCHRATDPNWLTATFNHAATFPLVGLHATQACATCHVNNLFKGTPRTCVGCHMANYQRTTTPNHGAAGYSTTCDTCHKATDPNWLAATFNHAATFPLVGLHATQACATCHINNLFKGTPRTCVGCHLTNYQKTTTPNHAAAGYSTTCDSCHKATDPNWLAATFNHAATFPLVGLHATQACATCHVNNVFKGTPNTCVGCHLANYQKTTTPNHAAAGYSTTCDSCHKATDPNWLVATFNHAATFPLVGLHATQACATCHVNNVFKGTPRTCDGCHLANYQKTTAPNHAAAGFSTTCDTCHRATDATWQGGTFNHNSVFQLLGVHATTVCSLCHVNNVYKGTPRTCMPCHQTDYQRTTNPNHIGAGFPTTCDTCHNAADANWTLGKFTHTWFPITSGRHSNIACATCHTNSAAYTQFSCLTGCHDRTSTDNHHRGRNGYVYDSNRCYACHPNGRAG